MSDGSDMLTSAAAGGGGFATVWLAAKWLLNFITGRNDRREAALAGREKELDAREAEEVKSLKAEVEQLKLGFAGISKELENHRVAIALLIAKVRREDPLAPELKIVADLLGGSIPVPFDTPPDMQADLDKLNRVP